MNALEGTEEVRIGTGRDASSPEGETAIRAVVVNGRTFVRSMRGEKGRRYREAPANSDVTPRVNVRRVLACAIPEAGPKYGASFQGPTAAMAREEVLATTPELLPA